MTATQRPRRIDRQAPRPSVPRPAPLRVVRPGEMSLPARRRRAGLLALGAGLLTAITLFGVVVTHVVLAQEQFRLARLQDTATKEQATNQQLQLEVAQLESPARIVQAAQQRLGMVTPPALTYLTPGTSHPPVPSGPAGSGGAAGTASPSKGSSASHSSTGPSTTSTTTPATTSTTSSAPARSSSSSAGSRSGAATSGSAATKASAQPTR